MKKPHALIATIIYLITMIMMTMTIHFNRVMTVICRMRALISDVPLKMVSENHPQDGKRMNIEINICHNDDDGERSDKCFGIEFSINEDTAIRLEPIDIESGEPIRISQFKNLPGRIEMYGGMVKFISSHDWHGSCMWNMYVVPDYYALGLLMLLHRSRKWNCMEAWTPIYEKWESIHELTWQDLELKEAVEPSFIDDKQIELRFPKTNPPTIA